MARALSVDRVVRVGINLQPMAAARRNFGTLLIIGASGVIDMENASAPIPASTAWPPTLAWTPGIPGRRTLFLPVPPPRVALRGTLGQTPTPAILKGGILSDGRGRSSAWLPS